MDNQKTESQQDKLNRLYTEYGLLKEDVHKHQHYTIIRRTGIEKIAAKAGIRLAYKLVKVQPDFAVVKATGKMGKGPTCVTAETYGSAGKDTSQNKYYVEMAEKRAKSRCVLQLTDFYAMGVYGEDEADDFDRKRNPEPREATEPRPTPPAASVPTAPASQPQVVPAGAAPSEEEEPLAKAYVLDLLNEADTLDELRNVWQGEARPWQSDTDVLAAKEARKGYLHANQKLVA